MPIIGGSIVPVSDTAGARTKPSCRGGGVFGALLAGFLIAAPGTGGAQAQETASQQPTNCAKYDSIRPRGTTTPYPSVCGTYFPELGGLREILFEKGWNLRGYATLASMYDIGKKNGEVFQTYNGQKPQLNGTLWFNLVYDLNRLGFNEGATFSLNVSSATSTWEYWAPTKTYIDELSIFTPFANNRADLKVGFVRAEREFYGQVIGTSLGASAVRAESAITIQGGMSVMEPSPYLGVTVYDKEHRFYNKTAVSQSMSPDGLFANAELKDNLFSRVPGAKALYVSEFGYRSRYDLGEKANWFRVGAIYNTSEYKLYDETGREGKNHAFYSQADIQLTQPNDAVSLHGWYLNLRGNYAPQDRNLYAGDISVSFYKIGTFPSRPADLFSFGAARSWFSEDARDQYALAGMDSEESQTTYSMSYAYAVTTGFYVNSALAYTDNPTFAPVQKPATVASVTMSVSF